MYACKFFWENKTANHIQAELDQILCEAGLDADNISCTTDKGQTWWLPQILSTMLIVHAIIFQQLLILHGCFMCTE